MGTGKKYTIIEVVEMICKILNWKPKEFKFDESKPVGALSRALENSRAYELLGWKPRFTLENGLKTTVDWFMREYGYTGKMDSEVLLEHS